MNEANLLCNPLLLARFSWSYYEVTTIDKQGNTLTILDKNNSFVAYYQTPPANFLAGWDFSRLPAERNEKMTPVMYIPT